MLVADDDGDAAEAALNKALKEGAPVCFGLAEGDADAENGAVAGGGDAQRRTAQSRSWPSWRTFS